jgi:hypothetical protein
MKTILSTLLGFTALALGLAALTGGDTSTCKLDSDCIRLGFIIGGIVAILAASAFALWYDNA